MYFRWHGLQYFIDIEAATSRSIPHFVSWSVYKIHQPTSLHSIKLNMGMDVKCLWGCICVNRKINVCLIIQLDSTSHIFKTALLRCSQSDSFSQREISCLISFFSLPHLGLQPAIYGPFFPSCLLQYVFCVWPVIVSVSSLRSPQRPIDPPDCNF